MAYTAINPYNGKTIKEYPNSTNSEIAKVLDKAEKYFHQSQTESVTERAQLLDKLANEIDDHIDDYALLASTNMGKLLKESKEELKRASNYARYYAKNAAEFTKPKQYDNVTVGQSAQVEISGIGIILAVEPWNFPYTQVMRVFAPNFILGNPVVLKHASIVPQVAEAFENACHKAGIPDGAFANVFATHDQVNTILEDKRVQGFALTGSEGAGRNLAAKAAKGLKKSTLELGGTDIFAVLEDADIDKAVKSAAMGRLANAGQVCTASKRYLISGKIYDEFLDKLKTEFDKYQVGDPLDEKTTLAPLSSKEALETLQDQVKKVVSGGAKVLYGNLEATNEAAFGFSPMILTGMEPDNPMYEEELFGPVAQIYRVKSDDELVQIANNSRHGLGGAIFTGDTERGHKLASRIETGQIAINHMLIEQAEVPFGGVKDSGYGRELSDWGFYEFANIKTVSN